MEFDINRVYTEVNADEATVGSKGYFADSLAELKSIVEEESKEYLHTLKLIEPSDFSYRFLYSRSDYALFYLVEEPEPEIKEVTAKEWDNNPRLMKVWDKDSFDSREVLVVYIISRRKVSYPVVGFIPDPGDGGHIACFGHCAELEPAKEPEAEKHYRPYSNADEFIADYEKRFCPDCKSIPAIWVKNALNVLKQVVVVMDEGIKINGLMSYSDLLDTYIYPDGSPCGMEE